MATLNPMSYFAARVYNGFAPRQKPKALGISLDFTATGSAGADIPIDLQIVEQEAWLEFVQAVFISNLLSGQTFSLISQISGQTLQLAAGRQGYLPFLVPPTAKLVASTGNVAANGMITIHLLNMPVPAIVW